MIKVLKTRVPVTVLPKEHKNGLRWGRWIYLGFLLLFSTGLLNHWLGPAFFLSADGLVLRQRLTAASPFEATVAAVYVQPGDRVKKGTPLLKVDSAVLFRTLAELSTRQAELISHIAAVKSKLVMTESTLPFAEKQLKDLSSGIVAMDRLRVQNLMSGRRVEETVTANYAAREKLLQLQAEKAGLRTELELLEQSYKEAESAISKLKQTYADGVINSPADGIVGPTVASPGDVLVSGAKALEIYAGEPYIMAYVPENYLFDLSAGMPVLVSTGLHSSKSVVSSVLPVADQLPPEFQNTFRPRDRSRLLRIPVASDQDFAIFQKVRVSECYSRDCNHIAKTVLKRAASVFSSSSATARSLR